ncbi:hypothetical protein NEUTE1DRAFT_55178, partial [Neurospora tetrasperma FGSC 2508]
AIYKYLNNYFTTGFIYLNSSPVAVLVLLIKKPGGGIYIYINYRGLNNTTIKNKYPISLIRKTIDAL